MFPMTQEQRETLAEHAQRNREAMGWKAGVRVGALWRAGDAGTPEAQAWVVKFGQAVADCETLGQAQRVAVAFERGAKAGRKEVTA